MIPSTDEQIERIKQHFAGNARVVFRDGENAINVYVDGEWVPIATMYPTVPATKDDVASFIWCIDSTLAVDRAALEAELLPHISTIPLQGLKAMVQTARQLGTRQVLDARYSIDAEGTHKDESWTLEQIMRSNPDAFCDEDIKKLRALHLGTSLPFGGGAWGEFTITRVS
jgi:hypothetical protein